MLLSLRVIADAVLIGPGTVRAEGYGRLVGPQRREDVPPAVLISRRFDIPWEAGLFAAPDQPVIVYGPADAPEPPDGRRAGRGRAPRSCTPGAALADLRGRGIRALLSEGGPTLFHGFLEAGFVDELFLTLTPVITGDEAETAIVSGARLPEPTPDGAAMGLACRGGTVPSLRDGRLPSKIVRRLAVLLMMMLAAPSTAHAAQLTVTGGELKYTARGRADQRRHVRPDRSWHRPGHTGHGPEPGPRPHDSHRV